MDCAPRSSRRPRSNRCTRINPSRLPTGSLSNHDLHSWKESTMTRTIGIGVIGMGWMGEVHSRSYRAIPDRFYESEIQPRLVVCADPVEARAQAAQKRFGFEHHTTDWRAVIADPAVEVVNVAAPNGM